MEDFGNLMSGYLNHTNYKHQGAFEQVSPPGTPEACLCCECCTRIAAPRGAFMYRASINLEPESRKLLMRLLHMQGPFILKARNPNAIT